MAAEEIQLKASVRDQKATATRAAEDIPAVLYGHGIKNQVIRVNAKAFQKAFQAAGRTSLVDLTVDGKEHNVLIKEVQQHPLRDEAVHIDFYQVRMDEKVKAQVSLTFTNESPAVKDKGGVFLRNIDAIEVEALPRDLPRELTVDISSLAEYDDVIRIADVPLPDGVEVLAEGDAVICLVQAPRTEEELEALEEEIAEDVEGVEGVKEDEETAEEGEGEGEAGEGEGEEKADEAPEEEAGE